jgi:hypothetical protein
MTDSEMQLLQKLNSNVDSFESYFEDEADRPVITTSQTKTSVGKSKGNPSYSAQFDVSVFKKYFTVVTATGVYTAVAASAINAGLKNSLPVFLFGQSDFKAGYANLKKIYPVNSNWVAGKPFIYGAGTSEVTPAMDVTVLAQLIQGDMVFPFTSALPGAGTTSLALVIVRCTQVAYGTLLESLSSDRFVLNMVRYVIPDVTLIAQYSNQIGIFRQSLFGRGTTDYLSPNSSKKPEQQQSGIIDIPLKKGFDKESALGMYTNYDAIELSWSIFVWSVKKMTA